MSDYVGLIVTAGAVLAVRCVIEKRKEKRREQQRKKHESKD